MLPETVAPAGTSCDVSVTLILMIRTLLSVKLALKKDGTQIADSVKEATGTTGETVTYSNLATGTYSIISAEGFTERSVRIISIKVTETSQDVPGRCNRFW